MAVPVISPALRKVFGTRNERLVKRYLRIVDQVSALEGEISKLTDAQLRAKTDEFRKRIEEGEKARDLIPEVFAVAREAMKIMAEQKILAIFYRDSFSNKFTIVRFEYLDE